MGDVEMDRDKIKKLSETILNTEAEIDLGVRQPVLGLHGNDWEQAPKFLDDCHYLMDELREAEGKIRELINSVAEMEHIIKAMHKEWQRTQALTVPSTIGEHVRALADAFLAGEDEVLNVDHVRERLEVQKVYLGVKNPSAVLASILARDKRLRRIALGLFDKRIPEGETPATTREPNDSK